MRFSIVFTTLSAIALANAQSSVTTEVSGNKKTDHNARMK